MTDRADLLDGGTRLSHLVERWAAATPDAVAVDCRGTTLTYRALDQAARHVADRLREHGLAPGSLVAIPADRRTETICTILGILKAGYAYLPLDVENPAARTAQILDQARPALILKDTRDLTPPAGTPPRHPVTATSRTTAADLAYVMPTSGSGGSVKLVEVGHASVFHNLKALSDAVGGITPQDAYLHVASFAFSSSVRQLFLPLSAGARVVIATETQRMDPQEMLRLIRDRDITIVDIIPSVLSVIVDAFNGRAPQQAANLMNERLRLLLLASEPLPAGLVRTWLTTVGRPEVAVYNMYGQTETAGIICLQRIDAAPDQGIVAIGRPLPGCSLSLVDAALAPVGKGAVGEITVAGPCLSHGYRGDSDLTAAKFLACPEEAGEDVPRFYRTGDLGRLDDSGAIEFVGRRDRMVKVRGHSVDLTQVERTLGSHAAVAEAAVVVSDHGDDTPHLRAYARLRPGHIDEEVASRLRILPNGLRILDLNPPETDFMYEEIFGHQVYLRHGIGLPDDAQVIDAGANIGLFSLSVATRYPNARILAFEPAAPTAGVLKTNLRINACSNVTVRVQGLSDHNGTATLTWYPHSTGMSSVHADRADEHATLTTIIANQLAHGTAPHVNELHDLVTDLADAKLMEQTLPCVLTRLSDVLDLEDFEVVDLLKIDVQKSEHELLAGIADKHWNRIKQIVAEVHDIDGRLDQVTTQLAQRGYTVSTEQDPMFDGSNLHYLYARRDSARPPAPPSADAGRDDTFLCVSSRQLTAFLATQLSASHLPAFVKILEDFPRTVSGKIDRVLLSQHAQPLARMIGHPGSEPVDSFTADVMTIWSDVLGRPVTVLDDFFTTGGSSLSAARVISRIRRHYDAPGISIRLIFENPQLNHFAARIQELLAPVRPD